MPARTLDEIMRRGATRAEAALFLNISPPSLDGMVRSGAPRRSDHQFDLLELASWKARRDASQSERIEAGDDSEKSLVDLRRARLQLVKVNIAEKVGKLISLDSAVEQMSLAAVTVRHRLNAMVAKSVPLIIACRTIDEGEEVMQREIDEVLATLQRGLDPSQLEPEVLKMSREREAARQSREMVPYADG